MANKRLIWKDEFDDTHSVDEKINGKFVGDKDIREKLYEYEQEESEGRLIHLPCAVKDLIDKVIGHNEIVAIWERRKNKEGRYHALLWKGMAWDIPEEYLDRTFLKIFGTVPESITEADTVNIAVTPILISADEAEQAIKEREDNG